MTPRKDDTPEILLMAFWFCLALAFGGWALQVLHG